MAKGFTKASARKSREIFKRNALSRKTRNYKVNAVSNLTLSCMRLEKAGVDVKWWGYVKAYLEWYAPGKTKNTYNKIRGFVEKFAIKLKDQDITPESVGEFFRMIERTRGQSEIVRCGIAIKAFFNWLISVDAISPKAILWIPKYRVSPPKKPKIITHDEYETILSKVKRVQDRYMFVVGYRTGLSMVDIALLTWDQVNFQEMYIQKVRIKQERFGTKNTATIPIIPGSDLHEILSWHWSARPRHKTLRKIDYVSPVCAYYYIKGDLRKRLNDKLKRWGINKTFKCLRNAFISHLANSGVNLAVACKITGHSDPKTFYQYLVPDMESMRLAIQKTCESADKNIHNHERTKIQITKQALESEHSAQTTTGAGTSESADQANGQGAHPNIHHQGDPAQGRDPNS